MPEVLLARHTKSFANQRDVAFGNVESPLTEKGIGQAKDMNGVFREVHGIVPEEYERAVLASKYLRPQQTAQYVDFRIIETSAVINEVEIAPDMLARGKILEKHRDERWVPAELQDRAGDFIQRVRSGQLDYQIYFTHGFFIAAVLNQLSAEHEARSEVTPYVFDENRGFIPRLATITPAII